MRALLHHRTYVKLFAAQLVALVGTGLATVALGLLAYDLAGESAGVVLGTALAVKMIAYVTVSPVVGAWADRVPRRVVMVSADVVRGLVVLALPFVTQVWQVYALIAVLQSASAAFPPTFQSVLPDVLPDESDSAAETILSPLLAAAALTVLSFHDLFVGTAIGFAVSAVLVVTTAVPAARRSSRDRFRDRLSSGMKAFGTVPALRAVLAFDLVIAATGAITLVSTVNVVRDLLAGSEADVALLLAVSGAGTATAAVVSPRLLRVVHERTVMLSGSVIALVSVAGAVVLAAGASWGPACVVWAGIGLGNGLTLMPIGRVLRRAGRLDDRPAVFAAQFSLSHACWLLTYPLTGRLAAVVVALVVWPRRLTRPVLHTHDDSAAGHGWSHSHEVMDDAHHHPVLA